MGIEDFHHFGEVGERPSETVDFVNDNYVDEFPPDVGQQALQSGALHTRAGEPTVVVTGFDYPPAFAVLAADVGLAGLALALERIEFLLEPFLRGFAGVDGAAPKKGWLSGLRSPKKAGPDQRLPVIILATCESER